MGCGTGLDPDDTCAKLLEKPQKLAPPQTPANNDLARCINTVNLKNALRDIQTNRANFISGGSPLAVIKTTAIWHLDAGGGAVHSIISGPMKAWRITLLLNNDDISPF